MVFGTVSSTSGGTTVNGIPVLDRMALRCGEEEARINPGTVLVQRHIFKPALYWNDLAIRERGVYPWSGTIEHIARMLTSHKKPVFSV
jgi:hypothetical protein